MSHGLRVVRTDVSSGGLPTSPPGSSSGPVDTGYAGSCPAILKVAQMPYISTIPNPFAKEPPSQFKLWCPPNLTLLIGFICIRCSRWTDYKAYNFFEIITMCDFVMILIFYIVYIFRVYRMLSCINWPLAEFLHYLIGTFLLLIASIVAVAKSYEIAGLVAGSIFGFFATILCIMSIWLSYKVSCVTQSTDAAV